MKPRFNSFLRSYSLLAAAIALTTSAQAADFTWDGGTGNWTDTNWNSASASGPTSAGNTATINSGTVTANVGGPGNLDSIVIGSGGQLNLYNGDGNIFAYQGIGNLNLQGGTVNGGFGTYNAYGASFLGNVTVSGTAASTITGPSWFNVGNNTYTVADVTGNSATDLLVSTSLRGPAGSPDWTYNAASITKEGAGTMEFTVHSYFWGGLTLNGGTIKVSGGNGGYGFFSGNVTVNAGTTLETVSDGTGLGWNNGWKPASVNINGGTITTAGTSHIWGIGGGINMTGGTLQSNNGVSDANGPQLEWNYTNVTTNASADTATIGGRIRIRADGGYSGISFDVADGAAANDLVVSAAITEASGGRSITKTGAGTMALTGANSYTGTTTVSAGTLVLSGTGNYTGSIQVNGGTLSLSNPVIDDATPVVIADGATVNLNFTGNDTVGSLNINGSGPLPAGTYNASTPGFETYFTGTGSLVVAGASGTWTSLADGNWSDAANWQSNIVATGYDATATFNAATGATVTLDSNRIIGNLAFDVSDYTLAGANTLNLDASATPAISVNSGRTATISANLGGTLGMQKTGAGTLVFTGVKSYTGGTNVTGGTLELAGGNSGNSIIRGALTIGSGATVSLTGGDGSGFGWNNPVTSININGGTIDAINSSHIGFGSFATMILDNGSSVQGSWQWNGDGLLGFASYGDSTNSISGNLNLRADAGANHTFFVDEGASATDLQIDANLSDQWPEYQAVPASGLTKSGAGTLVLNGNNTYDGNTVVSDGALNVTATSKLHFRPTTNGATNSVTGSATGALSFLGTVDLDLSAAVAAGGNVWNLFNLTTFTGATPTLDPAGVTSTLGVFAEGPTGTWKLAVTGAEWVFTEADGNLAYVVTATDYDTWVTANGVTGGPNDDDDSDGLTNHEEYAFGLDPTGGSSVNAITVPLDKTTGTFSYTRRLQSLTGLTYSVWYSTDLAGWTQDTGAAQGTPSVSGDVETVPVTLSAGLLSNPKLFIQVRAN